MRGHRKDDTYDLVSTQGNFQIQLAYYIVRSACNIWLSFLFQDCYLYTDKQ